MTEFTHEYTEEVEQPKVEPPKVEPQYTNPVDVTKPAEIEMRDSGFAIITNPDPHVGQVHVVQGDGTIDNYVGPRVQSLVKARDGGPYLDEVETSREELRRQHVMDRQQVVNVSLPDEETVKDLPEVDASYHPVAETTVDESSKQPVVERRDEFGVKDL